MVARSPDGGIHCASAGRLCRPRANPPFASDSRFSGAPAAAYVVFEPVSKPPASSVPGDGEADSASRCSGAPAAAYVVFEPVSKPPASSAPGDGEADAGSRRRPCGGIRADAVFLWAELPAQIRRHPGGRAAEIEPARASTGFRVPRLFLLSRIGISARELPLHRSNAVAK